MTRCEELTSVAHALHARETSEKVLSAWRLAVTFPARVSSDVASWMMAVRISGGNWTGIVA